MPNKLSPSPNIFRNFHGTEHWSLHIQETVVSTIHDSSLCPDCITLQGGADDGKFIYIANINYGKISYHGEKLLVNDIVLEVQGQRLTGYTLRDASLWLIQASHIGAPVMFKTLEPGEILHWFMQLLLLFFQ